MAEPERDDTSCQFCGNGCEVEDIAGKLHAETNDSGKLIAAHHRCMQYASALTQYKSSEFGGFDVDEVQKEISRGNKMRCSICKSSKGKLSRGACCGCAVRSCRKTYHYTCAYLHQETITKRLVVTTNKYNDREKFVYYRVFCSPAHEDAFKKTLKDELRCVKSNQKKPHRDKENRETDGSQAAETSMTSSNNMGSSPLGLNTSEQGCSSPVCDMTLSAAKLSPGEALLKSFSQSGTTGMHHKADDDEDTVNTDSIENQGTVQASPSDKKKKDRRKSGFLRPKRVTARVSQPPSCSLIEEMSNPSPASGAEGRHPSTSEHSPSHQVHVPVISETESASQVSGDVIIHNSPVTENAETELPSSHKSGAGTAISGMKDCVVYLESNIDATPDKTRQQNVTSPTLHNELEAQASPLKAPHCTLNNSVHGEDTFLVSFDASPTVNLGSVSQTVLESTPTKSRLVSSPAKSTPVSSPTTFRLVSSPAKSKLVSSPAKSKLASSPAKSKHLSSSTTSTLASSPAKSKLVSSPAKSMASAKTRNSLRKGPSHPSPRHDGEDTPPQQSPSRDVSSVAQSSQQPSSTVNGHVEENSDSDLVADNDSSFSSISLSRSAPARKVRKRHGSASPMSVNDNQSTDRKVGKRHGSASPMSVNDNQSTDRKIRKRHGSASPMSVNDDQCTDESESSTSDVNTSGVSDAETGKASSMRSGGRKRQATDWGPSGSVATPSKKPSRSSEVTDRASQACILLIPSSMEEFGRLESLVTEMASEVLDVEVSDMCVWQQVTGQSLPPTHLLFFMLDLLKELENSSSDVLQLLFSKEHLSLRQSNYAVQATLFQNLTDEKSQRDLQATVLGGLERKVKNLPMVQFLRLPGQDLATLAVDVLQCRDSQQLKAFLQAYKGLFRWEENTEAVTVDLSVNDQRQAAQAEALIWQMWLTKIRPTAEVIVLPTDTCLLDPRRAANHVEFYDLVQALDSGSHGPAVGPAGDSAAETQTPLLVFHPVDLDMLRFEPYLHRACHETLQAKGWAKILALVPLANLHSRDFKAMSRLMSRGGIAGAYSVVSVCSAVCPNTQWTSLVLLEISAALPQSSDCNMTEEKSRGSVSNGEPVKRPRGRPRKNKPEIQRPASPSSCE